MTEPDWAWSTDEESFSTIDEMRDIDAIAEAAADRHANVNDGETATIWIGKVERCGAASSYLLDASDWMLDRMDDNACDDGAPEGRMNHFSEASTEAREALDQKLAATIDQWATEHGLQPRWFTVVRPIEIEFTIGASEDETITNAWDAYEELLEAAE